ncbi:hypothetical protein KKH23_07685 [Patescibacteria group bacterium]|nr:hypothetical protein [Patescibacteria group bacterium]
MNDLFWTDGVLYVAFVLAGYGATAVADNFVNGLVALVLSAGLVVLRAFLKKKGYEKRVEKKTGK